MPQYAAGSLTEPPPSAPTAAPTRRPPTEEAEPLDDPPAQRDGSHGLQHGP
jgi:hypothetical protein